MDDRTYLSIGQVLDLLKLEFPDLTISKIRFLESQGLLDPERTPSGYRKFYEGDIERLRFILREQQEHYLPLKVIRGRLGTDEPEPLAHPAVSEAAPVAPAAATNGGPPPRLEVVMPEDVGDGVSMTLEELAEVAGLAVADIGELERFGLLSGRKIAGTLYYDADCLEIARLAAGFRGFGVEARHLRMYRTAVEREAGFFEQVVTPMLKQRNPQARRQAVDTLREMSRLGQALRAAIMRQALHDYTGGVLTGARVLFSDAEVQEAVQRLGRELSTDYPDGVLLIGVLKGSVCFLADLARAMSVSVEVDFLAISSYAPESGRVRIVKDLDADVFGRDVVLVEDIVDTGLTLTYLMGELSRRSPRSLEVCTLLDKGTRRIVPTPVRYVGFAIGDDFVLGYGMDFAERYRNLDAVVAGDLAALRADPNAHVEELFER